MRKIVLLSLSLMTACCNVSNAQVSHDINTSQDDLMPGTQEEHYRIEEMINGSEGQQAADGSYITESLKINYRKAYEAIQAGDYTEAKRQYEIMHRIWGEVFFKAPLLGMPKVSGGYQNLYINPRYMFEFLIDNEPDASTRLSYFADYMTLWRTRIANLDAINAMQTDEAKKNDRGVMLCQYAYWYYMAGNKATKDTDREIDINDVYKTFQQGIAELKKNNDVERMGDNVVLEAYALDAFIRVSQDLYISDNSHRGQFLQDYLDCKAVCEMMLERAKDPAMNQARAKQIVDEYDPILQTADALLLNSHAADRDMLIAYFEPKIEENKGNLSFLRNALTLMAENECDSCECYYKAAEYAYKLNPTFESAIASAKRMSENGDLQGSIRRYEEALSLAASDRTRATIALNIAQSLSRSGQYVGSYAYLDRAAKYDGTLIGKVEYTRALCLAREKDYEGAIVACTKAADADITVEGPANRLKASCETVLAKFKEQAEKYAAWQREHDAILKKQKEEEDFWTKGRR
ncbi:MAG: hypothetical protein HUK00_02825 [Bacteroidaceae bacterium]|nr:hypothetical protein [Bacteroidaceae bacterium]